jgi:ankyrin repeat protein
MAASSRDARGEDIDELAKRLKKALFCGDAGGVETLLSRGAKIEPPALIWACSGASGPEHDDVDVISCVNQLLAAGADPDGRNSVGNTPLIAAVTHVYLAAKLVHLLLSAGANPYLIDGQGHGVLYHAVFVGNATVVEALIKHGVNPSPGGM